MENGVTMFKCIFKIGMFMLTETNFHVYVLMKKRIIEIDFNVCKHIKCKYFMLYT